MPDSGGEGQESGSDACFDALKGACAVLFEGELAFESVEDGFYPLPDPAEFAEAWLLVLPVGSDEVGAQVFADESFEVGRRSLCRRG